MSDVIPEGWKLTNIGELTSNNSLFSDGDWVESKDQDHSGENRLIQLADIGDGIFINKSSRFMNNEQFDRLKCTELKQNDILVARMPDPLGRACLYPLDNIRAATIVDIAIIRTTNADHYWLMSAINSSEFRFNIELNASGTTRTRIARGALSKLPIPAPPLPEQQKIAAILSSVDDVIEKTQAQIEKLKDLKTGMMQELLSPREPNAGDQTSPKASKANGLHHTDFKDSPLGRIPVGWEVFPLDQVSKVIDCKHATPKYFNDGFAVVKPGNIKEGNLDLTGCAKTDKEGFENLNENHKPEIGDTIYSRNQTYGIGAFVFKEMKFAIGQDVCIIHPKTCLPKYLYYTVNAPVVKHQVELLAAGSTFKRINLGAIRQLLIPVPPMEEQKVIEKTLASIDAKASVITNKLSSFNATKKALMQDLLTGKVRVKVDTP